jgi:hypothetical protein
MQTVNAALKWKVGAEKLLSNAGINQGGTSRSTQKRKKAHSQDLQKAAAQSYSLAKLFQRQRLLGISMKSQTDDSTPSQGEREELEDFPEGQPPELALHECISDVLDPEEEREKDKQAYQEKVKLASQDLQRLLDLITLQKKKYNAELGIYSSFRKRHQMVQSFLWLEQKKQKVGGKRRERALQVARSYNRGTGTARKIVQWTNSWIERRVIPEGRAGKNLHTFSWLEDEGVAIAAREFARKEGERKYIDCTSLICVSANVCVQRIRFKFVQVGCVYCRIP